MKHTERQRLLALLGAAVLAGLTLGTSFAIQGEVPTIQRLQVDLWPEYDQPRLLVIYRGELEAPPSQALRLPIPADAAIHAVAYVATDGRLMNLQWESVSAGDEQVVVLTPPTVEFQIEYYWDVLGDDPEKSFTLPVTAGSHRIASLLFQVQEPVGATGLQGDPPLQGPTVGFQGLNYYVRDAGALEPGQTARQTVRYVKASRTLSIEAVQPAPAEAAPPPASTASGGQRLERFWLPIVAAVFLVIGSVLLGFGIWRARREAMPAAVAPPTRRRTRSRPRKKPGLARFCHACGHPFEPEDRFCAQCGAERRPFQ